MKHVVSHFLHFYFLSTIECECDGGYFGIAIHSDEDNVTFSFSHVATDLVDRYFILQFCTLLITAVVIFIL